MGVFLEMVCILLTVQSESDLVTDRFIWLISMTSLTVSYFFRHVEPNFIELRKYKILFHRRKLPTNWLQPGIKWSFIHTIIGYNKIPIKATFLKPVLFNRFMEH